MTRDNNWTAVAVIDDELFLHLDSRVMEAVVSWSRDGGFHTWHRDGLRNNDSDFDYTAFAVIGDKLFYISDSEHSDPLLYVAGYEDGYTEVILNPCIIDAYQDWFA